VRLAGARHKIRRSSTSDRQEISIPIVMCMEWDGVTPEQYDEARAIVDWEQEVPDGAILHPASVSGRS
jgi:hypothetical protein